MTLMCHRFHRLAPPIPYSRLIITLETIINRYDTPTYSWVTWDPPAPTYPSFYQTNPVGRTLHLLHHT
ncbi:hypothetical protein N657DRAFT_642250 [Parathielavia appendiculata]|uniref:Uncharacterized protein n=1 Tax=Parathielavia appendiculata TaxID=2587402 RepID=A0AAN6U2Y9_9PEZI|nr:hypothetical protein N657DRAFT_642250 [Parathielavia appendiculata]